MAVYAEALKSMNVQAAQYGGNYQYHARKTFLGNEIPQFRKFWLKCPPNNQRQKRKISRLQRSH
jgi:hypothetical protein